MHLTKEMRVQETVRFPVEVAPERFHTRMLRWPRVSPDGKKVVFQTLGVLWARDLPNGEPRRLTSQTDHFEFFPSFSPDGSSIVYTTWDDQEQGSVRVVPASGGSGRVLTPTPGNYVEPTFSPDGGMITYLQISGGYLLSPLWSLETGIYTDPDLRWGAEPGLAKRVYPRFTADGQRIYYLDSGDTGVVLKSVDLNGQDERTLAKGSNMVELAVSPDGKWVAFVDDYRAYVAPLAASRQGSLARQGHELDPGQAALRSSR